MGRTLSRDFEGGERGRVHDWNDIVNMRGNVLWLKMQRCFIPTYTGYREGSCGREVEESVFVQFPCETRREVEYRVTTQRMHGISFCVWGGKGGVGESKATSSLR